jgi:hypothetical protein
LVIDRAGLGARHQSLTIAIITGLLLHDRLALLAMPATLRPTLPTEPAIT